jgi:hypothetical protein
LRGAADRALPVTTGTAIIVTMVVDFLSNPQLGEHDLSS